MKKRDIKLGEYYYVVHDIKKLYCSYFPVKALVEKFKMTKDILIVNPRSIFKRRIDAQIKAVGYLNKFRDEQIVIMNKLRIAEDKDNFTGIYSTDGVDK